MIQIKVNGVEHTFNGDPEMPLLWYLRDELGLTGTKFGCGIALCGAWRGRPWQHARRQNHGNSRSPFRPGPEPVRFAVSGGDQQRKK